VYRESLFVCFVAHETFSGWYIAKDTRMEITQQTYVFLSRFLVLLSFSKTSLPRFFLLPLYLFSSPSLLKMLTFCSVFLLPSVSFSSLLLVFGVSLVFFLFYFPSPVTVMGSVDILIRLRPPKELGVQFPAGAEIVPFSKPSMPAVGAHPASCVVRSGDSYRRGKAAGA